MLNKEGCKIEEDVYVDRGEEYQVVETHEETVVVQEPVFDHTGQPPQGV